VIPLERTLGLLAELAFTAMAATDVNLNRCPVLDPRLDRPDRPLKHDSGGQ